MSPVVWILLTPILLTLAYVPTWFLPPQLEASPRITRREANTIYLLAVATLLCYHHLPERQESALGFLVISAALVAPLTVGIAGRRWVTYLLLTVVAFSALGSIVVLQTPRITVSLADALLTIFLFSFVFLRFAVCFVALFPASGSVAA